MRNKKEKKNVVPTTSKKLKLSKESKRFLDCMEYVFGVLVAEYIKERMLGLSKDRQHDMVWNIFYYLDYEEVLPTGDLDMDIKLYEVVEVLPFANIEFYRMICNEYIPKTPKVDDEPMYAN